MHMICPPKPIHASAELTEFLYISCRKKYRTLFRLPPCWLPGTCPSAPYPLPLLGASIWRGIILPQNILSRSALDGRPPYWRCTSYLSDLNDRIQHVSNYTRCSGKTLQFTGNNSMICSQIVKKSCLHWSCTLYITKRSDSLVLRLHVYQFL